MDIVETAPVGGAQPIAPVDTPAMNVTEAARALSQLRWKSQNPDKPEPGAEPAAAQPDSSQEVAAAPETDPGVTTEAPAPAELPPIDAPRSWTKDEQERFKTYPRELQAYLSEREQERDRDLRRRQNEAAEARKAIEAEQREAQRLRQEYEAKLPQLVEAATASSEFADIKTHADVEKLANEDPFRFARWQAHQMRTATLANEARQAEQKRAEEAQRAWATFAQEQDKLFAEKAPDIADPVKGPKLREGAATVLRDTGFTDQELAEMWNGRPLSLRDHRTQLLILDALKYRDAKASAAKPLPKEVPQVQKPGVAPDKGTANREKIVAAATKLTSSKGTNAIRAAAELLKAQRAAHR